MLINLVNGNQHRKNINSKQKTYLHEIPFLNKHLSAHEAFSSRQHVQIHSMCQAYFCASSLTLLILLLSQLLATNARKVIVLCALFSGSGL